MAILSRNKIELTSTVSYNIIMCLIQHMYLCHFVHTHRLYMCFDSVIDYRKVRTHM